MGHSVAQYVHGMAHTNGVESFWAMLKRAHKASTRSCQPSTSREFVHMFAGHHNVMGMDTLGQMQHVFTGAGGPPAEVRGT